MYPIRIGNNLLVSLEMKLGIVDEKPLEENILEKFMGIKQGNYVDTVTHIFGTYKEKNGLITFLDLNAFLEKLFLLAFLKVVDFYSENSEINSMILKSK